MVIPVMITWVTGTIVTAAQFNAQIRDAMNFQYGKPFCNVYNNAGVATTTATYALIPFDTETEDSDGMHSTVTNSSRIICQTPGLYFINIGASWPANNALINRRIQTRLNAAGNVASGSLIIAIDSGSASTGTLSTGNNNLPQGSFFYRFVNIGDYAELWAFQTSGAGITTMGGAALTYYQAGLWNL